MMLYARRVLSSSVIPRRVVAVQYNGSPSKKTEILLDDHGTLTAKPAVLPQGHYAPTAIANRIIRTFLPENHTVSVTPSYTKYVSWQAITTTATSASGVLSMQSLLFAVGLGAGSIPLAAALNWIIKDGLGQIGGVIFASWVNRNNKLDAEPKRYRIFAGLCLDLAGLMEILSPLAPQYFLLIASTSNIAKNIAWMTTSATKAGIHRSFILRENLGDVTAKSASQATACSVIGTGAGILISSLVGTDVSHLLIAFSGLSVIHMFSTYKSLTHVAIRTFNHQRLERVIVHYLLTARKNVGMILPPSAIGCEESFISTYKSVLKNGKIIPGACLESFILNASEFNFLQSLFSAKKYIVHLSINKHGKYSISIAWDVTANSKDQLESYFLAGKLSYILDQTETDLTTIDARQLLAECICQTDDKFAEFLQALSDAGWDINHSFLENSSQRFYFEKTTS